FASVSRVACESPSLGIDDQIQHLQGYLANEHGHLVGHFHRIHAAVSPLKGQAYRLIHCYLPCADARGGELFVTLRQPELLYERRRKGEGGGAGIDEGIIDGYSPYLVRRAQTALHIEKISQVLNDRFR